jgi:hypothetical protein
MTFVKLHKSVFEPRSFTQLLALIHFWGFQLLQDDTSDPFITLYDAQEFLQSEEQKQILMSIIDALISKGLSCRCIPPL